jgi:hypothetical protein
VIEVNADIEEENADNVVRRATELESADSKGDFSATRGHAIVT